MIDRTLVIGRHGKLFASILFAATLIFLGARSLAASRIPQLRSYELVPGAHAAAVDYFLKLDGIDGESTDDRHRNEIQIESFSWGVSQMGTGGAGGGGGAGKASFQDIHFTKTMDKASPKLMLAVATGEHIKQAVLVARKTGQGPVEFYKVTLSDVMVSSYQSSGEMGSVPTDEFSLNFSKIEFEYRPQDGTAAVKTGYDVKANKKV